MSDHSHIWHFGDGSPGSMDSCAICGAQEQSAPVILPAADLSSEFGQRLGWDVFERSDGYRDIERDDDAERFDSDAAAYNHVRRLAAAGDGAATEALALVGTRWE